MSISSISTDASSAQSGTSPFLRLPFDIRLLIYRYLIPAIDSKYRWTCAWDPHKPKELSKERKLYSPPILHTNQIIHREVLNELHTFWPYRMSVNNYGIRCMGYTFSQPPPAFRYIHTMDLMIHIDSYSYQKIAETLSSFLEVTCVNGNLRRLQIGLTFSLLCFQIHMGNLGDLQKALEQNLNPLRRQLRGIKELVVRQVTEDSLSISNQNVSDVFLRQRDDFLDTVQNFMERLVKDVTTKPRHS